ncbi:hypothetical protein [Bacillus alkalicellulosilyticus]|uniref:hypothetical protein n=1 Tax=Alkalihalobacterium alkalicellulosilyticum TaxID=1912214 RepID=UPI00099705F4|nr:hypothetical protein [Bacillus alkalicellulosilyticus]
MPNSLKLNEVETEYYFRRTYFLIDSDTYGELVSLAEEKKEIYKDKVKIDCDFIGEGLREVRLSDNDLSNEIRKNEILREEFKINHSSFLTLEEKYKERLFDITGDIINKLNLN